MARSVLGYYRFCRVLENKKMASYVGMFCAFFSFLLMYKQSFYYMYVANNKYYYYLYVEEL